MSFYLPRSAVPLLYIDDNADDRALLELAIQRTKTPFTLYTAESPQSAVQHFNRVSQTETPNPFPRPELILLDYEIGARRGTDFIVWLRHLKGVTAIPVIMFSGSSGRQDIAECYHVGANHFVRKPDSFGATQAFIRALYLCMSFRPPRFGPLTRLPEYELNPQPPGACPTDAAWIN